ncbi:serine/threonine protein phosphatase PrpC [Glaciihabitans tibetensis]|uniref:Serine/threonine protein phosphatase PrpC n=1 Tax=Glaciihabitans tibetensis TaxID=1266600 RepID=A0A2T0VG95_9MICO|nr:protein phosphatase 2C domain-containing protein [Glaciihabitans tibetensis]PRY69192.1 serine/threonine protein phosphatase PrpC [Glaciihabitans tibetensis]
MQTTSVVLVANGEARLSASAQSVVGMVRRVNEDSYLARSPLFVVADGMGGHERGDRASQAIIATLDGLLPKGSIPTSAAVVEALSSANDAVRALGDEHGRRLMSGSTLAGVCLVGRDDVTGLHWMVFNVGDSRIYSWDGRSLVQLSVDHSAVQEMVDAGELTNDGARRHPNRNIITRAVGAEDSVEADIWLLPADGPQSFLICSDGLTRDLEDEDIARVLAEYGVGGTQLSVADALVDAANIAGGGDNITAVVLNCEVTGASPDDRTSERAGASAIHDDTRPRL